MKGGCSPSTLPVWQGPMEGESSAKCRACGSFEVAIWDADTGNTVCPSCGTVDDTQKLVSNEFYPSRDQDAYYWGLLRDSASSFGLQGAEWHLQNHLVSARMSGRRRF